MIKRILIYSFILLLLLTNCDEQKPPKSADAEAIYFNSKYLHELTYFLVYEPEAVSEPSPVLYLLNGWGGSPYGWGSGADLQKAADDYNMIIVSLTAGENRYVDIQDDSTCWYMSYTMEIVDIVDTMYNTIDGRALCGISNGGSGAIYIASHNPDKFCSVSSLSGGVYDNPYFINYINLENINILLDIGTEDGMLEEMQGLHNQLSEFNISHEYNEYPGDHSWQFWQEHYEEHFQFHYNNFYEE